MKIAGSMLLSIKGKLCNPTQFKLIKYFDRLNLFCQAFDKCVQKCVGCIWFTQQSNLGKYISFMLLMYDLFQILNHVLLGYITFINEKSKQLFQMCIEQLNNVRWIVSDAGLSVPHISYNRVKLLHLNGDNYHLI